MGHDEVIDFRGVDHNLVRRVLIHNDSRDLKARVVRAISRFNRYRPKVISALIVAADQEGLSYFLDKIENYPKNYPSLTVGDFVKECYRELGINY